MPPDIAAAVKKIGPVIDPPGTAILFALLQKEEPYAGVTVARDEKYGSDPRNRLDVFQPATASTMPRPILIFVHGGAFTGGDKHPPDTVFYDNIMLWAVANGMVGVNITYRLAPEHPYPAQQEDALAAYRWLLQGGTDPRRLALMGDSAGGNLVLCLLRRLHREGLPMPAAAVCLSPWTDLANGGESMAANEPFDLIDRRMVAQWAAWYTHGRDPKDPEISPLYGDFAGFPPVYIQAGGAEIMIDMIRAYAEKARREGADVALDVWEHMIHNFQAFGDRMEESEDALGRIRDFVAARIGPGSSSASPIN